MYANPTGPNTDSPENACFSKGLELGTDRTLLGAADSLSAVGISNVALSPNSNGVSSWVFQFNDSIQSSTSISSVVTQDTTKIVSVNFCVYFGLADSTGAVVSYREVAIGLTISLQTQLDEQEVFQVGSAQITVVKDISLDYDIHAKLCGSNPPTTFKQGDEIALCLCTSHYPITKVSGIQQLVFIAGDSSETRQMAITDGTVVNSQLTAMGSCTTWGFEHCCQVNAILVPQFFARSTLSSSTGPRTVNLQGVGNLSIYTGGNRERRRLGVVIQEPPVVVEVDRELDEAGMENSSPGEVSTSHTTHRHFERRILVEYASGIRNGLAGDVMKEGSQASYRAVMAAFSIAVILLACYAKIHFMDREDGFMDEDDASDVVDSFADRKWGKPPRIIT